MSRMLLACELGSNLGHLSRVLALARRLKARGHEVLAAARDVASASAVLGPAGIPFVQSPIMISRIEAEGRPCSFSDLLWQRGWSEAARLSGLVGAWINLFRLHRPAVVVLDYAPTALLAARVSGTRCALIGTGFELPPLTDPLPAFPGIAGATHEAAAAADLRALEIANGVLRTFGGEPVGAMRDLFGSHPRWFTTLPELDHYGARLTERYVGPIGEMGECADVSWPRDEGTRIFAYLRPNIPALSSIVTALAQAEAAVLCYAPGVRMDVLEPLRRNGVTVSAVPINLRSMLRSAHVCVSYAPAGTVTSALLSGVPQLLAPPHVEAWLTSQKVRTIGAGIALCGHESPRAVAMALEQLQKAPSFRLAARKLADHYRALSSTTSADGLVEDLERITH